MSSGAKRLVQSLRGRTGGRGTGGGRSDAGAEDSGVGGGGASTSATRLCHYDSGHELDEISVIGANVRDNEGLTTPTTPCHCRSIKYGSGQTLCSIAGLPPAPAIPAHRAQSDTVAPYPRTSKTNLPQSTYGSKYAEYRVYQREWLNVE